MTRHHPIRRPSLPGLATRLLALGLALCAALPAAAQRAAEPRVAATPGDYIIAVVNQELVTAVELERRQAQMRAGRRARRPAAAGARGAAPAGAGRPDRGARDRHPRTRPGLAHRRGRDRPRGAERGRAEPDDARAAARAAARRGPGPDAASAPTCATRSWSSARASARSSRASSSPTRRSTARWPPQREPAAARPSSTSRRSWSPCPKAPTRQRVAERRRAPSRRWRACAPARPSTRWRASCPTTPTANAAARSACARPTRLPDLFVDSRAQSASPAQVTPELLRSGAGFHVLKLRRAPGRRRRSTVTETRARHILLRTSPQLTPEQAARAAARAAAPDRDRQRAASRTSRARSPRTARPRPAATSAGSAPGAMVPEFEEPLNAPAARRISEPVVSRFGVHLIQVLERRRSALDAGAAARAGAQRAARAQVRAGLPGLGRGAARARLRRDPRAGAAHGATLRAP